MITPSLSNQGLTISTSHLPLSGNHWFKTPDHSKLREGWIKGLEHLVVTNVLFFKAISMSFLSFLLGFC